MLPGSGVMQLKIRTETKTLESYNSNLAIMDYHYYYYFAWKMTKLYTSGIKTIQVLINL